MGRKISVALASLLISVNLFGAKNSSPYEFTQFNGSAYFFADDGEGVKLFKSDGTEAGTVSVTGMLDDGDGGDPENLTIFNSKLYFSAYGATTGFELWESDGTLAGTKLLKDLKAGDISSEPHNFVVFDSKLYFIAMGDSSNSIWKSDGTADGTTIVANGLYPSNLSPLGDKLFFSSNSLNPSLEGSLFKSDGTNQTQISAPNIYPSNLTAFDGKLYFQAGPSDTNYELWVSDGTEGGTKIFKDIRSGNSSSSPQKFTVCGDSLYFLATDGTNGYELWVTDGTEVNTKMVKNINSGGDVVDGEFSSACLDNKLYFRANDGTDGVELWVSDGTEANTKIVKDIRSGENGSYPYNLTAIGDKLYFKANDGTNGTELWVTDGTEAGTKMLKDINYDNKKPTISNLSIDGTFSVGAKLTVTYTYSDIESDDENGTLYLWYRADDDQGTNAAAIEIADGIYATKKTYRPTKEDIGKFLRVIVVPMDTSFYEEFIDDYGETNTDIFEAIDDDEYEDFDTRTSYTEIQEKVDLTSVVTANKWNMVAVPEDMEISVSDIAGATIFEYDVATKTWITPTTLTDYKGYWLYTTSTTNYNSLTAKEVSSEESLGSSAGDEGEFALLGNSQSYQSALDTEYLPFGYLGFEINKIFVAEPKFNKLCSFHDFYYDSVNNSWNTTEGIPYLGAFWLKMDNCITLPNHEE